MCLQPQHRRYPSVTPTNSLPEPLRKATAMNVDHDMVHCTYKHNVHRYTKYKVYTKRDGGSIFRIRSHAMEGKTTNNLGLVG